MLKKKKTMGNKRENVGAVMQGYEGKLFQMENRNMQVVCNAWRTKKVKTMLCSDYSRKQILDNSKKINKIKRMSQKQNMKKY